MSKTYDEKYAEIIEQYQEGLDKDSSNKLVQKIIEQPSRQPSYAKIDSDGDNKKELSEKNFRAIANLIIDSKNYILPQMQIINTFIHSVRITTILFVRTLFGNVSLN